jgi:hypothetical protein
MSHNLDTNITKPIYEIEDDISQYPFKKRVVVYILDDNSIILQQGYLAYNKARTFFDILRFKLFLHDITNKSTYEIKEKSLVDNGIYGMHLVPGGKLVIKTGTTLKSDDRWEFFDKSEAPDEYIFLIDKELFIRSVMASSDIPSIIIAHECWDQTINYFKCKGEYIIFGKVYYPSLQSETIYFDIKNNQYYTTKDGYCIQEGINGNMYDITDTESGRKFINVSTGEEILMQGFTDNMRYFHEDIIITTFWKQKSNSKFPITYTRIYKFPEMKLLMERKGAYRKCIRNKDNLVCIINSFGF